MGLLLASLGLEPSPGVLAVLGAAAKADSLTLQLGKDIKEAAALAMTVRDPQAKAAFAKALVSADADRKSAAALSDAGQRAQALQAARDKVVAATAGLKSAEPSAKSTTPGNVSKTTVGVDGYAQVNNREKSTVGAEGSRTTDSDHRKSTLGLDGLGYDKTVKSETESEDGKKSGSEHETSVKVGPGGATRTDTATRTRADGSADSSTKTTGIERGEGRIGTVDGRSDSHTDASGKETTTDTKTKAGLIAGKDGVGAFAEREKSYETKNANGMKTGAVAGLDAHVVCNVVAKGGEPASFELTVSIDLGMKASLSAGREKEGEDGASSSASVGVNASEAVSMTCRHVLGEAEAQAYAAALKSGSGTQQEFAIIRTGLGKGWPAARDMYLAMRGQALDKKQVDRLKEGESIEVGRKDKVGASVGASRKGGSGGVGIDGGYEVSHDGALKVTREKDGTLTYDGHEDDADKLSGGAKLDVGVVEGGANFSHANTTSTGYKISIDPKDPRAAEMQGARARCKTQKDLDAFAAKYPQSVQEKTKSKGSADTAGFSMGVGPVKVGLDYGHSLDEAVTTDKDGKFKKKVVTGGNSGGAQLGIGKLKIGASTEEKAVAEIDADGNVGLDLTKSDKSTNAAKWLQANVPGAGDKKDKEDEKKEGLLAKAAGGEAPDTDDKDLKAFNMNRSDLGYLGSVACNDWGRWTAAAPGNMNDDWMKAGRAIKRSGGDPAVVARELAKFVGADSGSRTAIVHNIARAPGDVSTGAGSEFPGSLAAQKDAYDALVIAASEKTLDGLKDQPAKLQAAADALVAQLEHLYTLVAPASGFSSRSTQAEMLAAINDRKEKVRAVVRVAKGGKADERSRDENFAKYNDYIDNCTRFHDTETELFAKIEATWKGGHPTLDQEVDNLAVINELRDLHADWQPQYDQMAALAQETGVGKDNYWRFKPDHVRLARAIQHGAPGPASAPTPETQDKRKKPAPVQIDQLGDAEREKVAADAAKIKSMDVDIKASRDKAQSEGNQLYKLVHAQVKPAAVDAHNRGMALFKRADQNAAQVKKGDLVSHLMQGEMAIEDYVSAHLAFAEGLALYPNGRFQKAA